MATEQLQPTAVSMPLAIANVSSATAIREALRDYIIIMLTSSYAHMHTVPNCSAISIPNAICYCLDLGLVRGPA